MRATRVLHAVDSHTEGMPTRVITGGVGVIPGASMAERRTHFLTHMDDLRTMLMYEPRGHSAMSGAILQPPTRPDADYGVLFIEVSGCLPISRGSDNSFSASSSSTSPGEVFLGIPARLGFSPSA